MPTASRASSATLGDNRAILSVAARARPLVCSLLLATVHLVGLAACSFAQTPSPPAAAQPPAASNGAPPAQAGPSNPTPSSAASAPDRPSRFLSNFFVGVQVGGIAYDFSSKQLQPGFQAQSVQTPHVAVRVTLFGHEFGKYLSAQLTDMRPILWVRYQDVNGDQSNHSVWMNVGGLTAKARLPLSGRFSLFGEGGVAVVTRKGFDIGSSSVVANASYGTFLFGGGLSYRLNEHWDFPVGILVAPGSAAHSQPATIFTSGGFTYTLRNVARAPVELEPNSTPLWPENLIEFGYATNAFGYGVNTDIAKAKLFWPGALDVANGFSLNYQRTLFHTHRWFALDAGVDISTWKSRQNGNRFYTASIYPTARIPLIRTNPFELYFAESLAGPAVITRTTIDGRAAGRNFTFQDYMALGTYWGRKRKLTAEVRIQHYSNGNLFPENPGITIPLGFYLGTTF